MLDQNQVTGTSPTNALVLPDAKISALDQISISTRPPGKEQKRGQGQKRWRPIHTDTPTGLISWLALQLTWESHVICIPLHAMCG